MKAEEENGQGLLTMDRAAPGVGPNRAALEVGRIRAIQNRAEEAGREVIWRPIALPAVVSDVVSSMEVKRPLRSKEGVDRIMADGVAAGAVAIWLTEAAAGLAADAVPISL